ncbi:hypothetical protein P0D72_33475 [Paraburkholderia sediminicola]|uniref:hypothetical protein n=1 Tax=Paraburkholderia sediminicola TaxID=458836 RepID=UPI0038B7B3EA
MWTSTKRMVTKLWGFIVAFGVLVGMLGAYGSFSPLLQRKALTFDVVSANSVEPSLDGLSLHLGDRTLPNLQLRTLRFQNSGSVPVQTADFNGTLNIVFHGGEVIKTSVLKENPSHLGVSISSKSADTVAVAPLLLNPGDFFEVQIATTKALSEPEVFARISGVSEVSKVTKPMKYREIAMNLFFAISGLAGYAILSSLLIRRRVGERITRLETILIMGGLTVMSYMPMAKIFDEFGIKPSDHAATLAFVPAILVALYSFRCLPRRQKGIVSDIPRREGLD